MWQRGRYDESRTCAARHCVWLAHCYVVLCCSLATDKLQPIPPSHRPLNVNVIKFVFAWTWTKQCVSPTHEYLVHYECIWNVMEMTAKRSTGACYSRTIWPRIFRDLKIESAPQLGAVLRSPKIDRQKLMYLRLLRKILFNFIKSAGKRLVSYVNIALLRVPGLSEQNNSETLNEKSIITAISCNDERRQAAINSHQLIDSFPGKEMLRLICWRLYRWHSANPLSSAKGMEFWFELIRGDAPNVYECETFSVPCTTMSTASPIFSCTFLNALPMVLLITWIFLYLIKRCSVYEQIAAIGAPINEPTMIDQFARCSLQRTYQIDFFLEIWFSFFDFNIWHK